MTRKQNKEKTAGDNKVKTPANSLSFLADEDPDILEEANKIKRLRKFKSVRPATREYVYEALCKARERLEAEEAEKLNKAS